MNILVINCGSSTLKFELFRVDRQGLHRLASGKVERIGGGSTQRFAVAGAAESRAEMPTADHGAGTHWAIDRLRDAAVLDGGGPDAIGFRIVHGGERFSQPARLDAGVVQAIEAASELAPLHNAGALAAIRAATERFGAVPMAAVFDTAFHRTMPERASRYAIAPEFADRHGIQRYGFHGIAHQHMSHRCAELMGRPLWQTRLITLQLGNGCSAAAVLNGRCIDTSMGFSPLEGLVMGTRCGDIDPAVVSHLCRRERVDAGEVERWLNTRSGLLGVSGKSQDMRELLALAASGDNRAELAIDLFCYRARKYVGAYLAALGGADAVVFGGGIGENAPEIRQRICHGFDWSGLILDPTRNAVAVGQEGIISRVDDRVRGYVIRVDEEAVIARETAAVLSGDPGGSSA